MSDENLFFRAIECESLDDRSRLLDEACGPDAEKRERIEALLEIHESAAGGERPFRVQETLDATSWDLAPSALDFLNPSERKASLGRLGRYEVLRVVGVGGTSVVLEALDTDLERIVAIKALARELCRNTLTRERFNREARSAASLSHPNIAQVLEIGEQNLVPYLVMEYVRGRSLQQRIRKGRPLPVEEVCRIGSQIARGLSAIHDGELIHRDIKPSNILLTGDEVKITDFGVAHCMDHVGLTRTGEIPGTPEFMSPEQAQCQDFDHRSDLFSLGTVLYTMATGQSPFQAPTPLMSMRRVCDEKPPPVRKVNPKVPRWLARVIQRLLEKSPEDRISTADEVAKLIDEQVAPWRTWKQARIPAVYAGVALIALALLIFYAPVQNPLQGAMRGIGTLALHVNGPEVELTFINANGRRHSVSPTGTIFGAGTTSVRLPPGPFQVVATRSGATVYSGHGFMPWWGEVAMTIDVPSGQFVPSPASARFVGQTNIAPYHETPPRVVSYQPANAPTLADGGARPTPENEPSSPQSIVLIKHDENVGSTFRTYLTFEIDRWYASVESVAVLLTPIVLEGDVGSSTKFQITRLPDARRFSNSVGTTGDHVPHPQTVEGAVTAVGSDMVVGEPVVVDVTGLFAAAGEVGGHVTLKVEIFAEQVDRADQVAFASHAHTNEAYRPRLQIATHESAAAIDEAGTASAGIVETAELRFVKSVRPSLPGK